MTISGAMVSGSTHGSEIHYEVTGDVYGAVIELAELGFLVIATSH